MAGGRRICLAFLFALASTPLMAQAKLPAPPAASAPPDDGQWVMPAKNFASTRYSELAEINARNVASLKVAFTFSTGVNKGHEAAPIVVGDTMYVLTPYPNILFALDLSKPGAPIKWKYEPRPEAASQGVACCDVVARGPAFADGRLFFNTLDGNTIALDAKDGRVLWQTKVGDIRIGETVTMAPFVAKGKVLVGNSGGEYGVRGWLVALDAQTGKQAWKAFGTGPDTDVLIGPQFKPFYDSDKGKDLGVSSWQPDGWRQGGGNMWGWISYDPELNMIFHGTGNPGPWNSEMRPGDNKWTGGIFARDIDTGAAKWFYQFTPHDLFDWDAINENILLDLDWKGTQRKVIVRPERNGFVYVIDRTSGEVLSATPYHPLTVTDGVDLKTGRLHFIESKLPQLNKVMYDVCPTAPGAKDWNPSAFSNKTGLLYIPHNNLCMDWQMTEVNYIAGTPYVGAEVRMKAGPGGHRGEMTAWNILEQKPQWTIKEDLPLWSGALATAGDLVFYGTMNGWFKAVDARSGEVLWQFKTGSGIISQPVTYRGPDGRQYVAVLSGIGGWAGALVSNDLDPRDATAAKGFVNAVRELKEVVGKGGMLYVFQLP
ncbi:MAG: PQQ-dependent dehydrogenase, methanol/ethanol family [Hyphomicrobiales bacterium]|nr:PQQ-dependent dehydrogenase, methanol/ethanol family [Hyphomicrobiales bacterium]